MTQRSSDIVERLREEPGQYSTLFVKAMFGEAADEIERLRAALDEVKAELLQAYQRDWEKEPKVGG